MSSKLDFLKTIQVVATEDKVSKPRGAKEWNPPSGKVIRLWRDGSVFPSKELVDAFDLEYTSRLSEEEVTKLKAESKPLPPEGYGFDVADSDEFPAFNTGGQRLLIISPVKREEGKVDLFASVTYNKDNTPKSTVMNQGNVTFGNETLIPWVEEIYGIKFYQPAREAREAQEEKKDEQGNVIKKASPAVAAVGEVPGEEYVDLVLLGKEGENSEPFVSPKGFAFFPKKFSRGESKGSSTIVRREHPQMYVLYPKKLMEQPEADTAEAMPADQTKG
jgi:hypothetical protein